MQCRSAWLTLASALLLGSCGGKEGAGGGADPFVGRWRAVSEHGSSELTLERRGEGYVLRFAFELRGDLLAARYTVLVPRGEPLELPEVVYGRVGQQSGGGGGGGGAGAGDVASSLAGHWRHTEALSSGGVSLVTDTHLVLHADGTCSTWSHSEGVASGREPESPGRWRTQGDQLLLKADAGGDWTSVGRFVFDGTRLMLVRPNGDKQVYERL